uniref:CatB-related O-acetyltransferase n=1 Tax=Algoriphagus sp. TaxID=1872435 RepID=UPI0040478E3C
MKYVLFLKMLISTLIASVLKVRNRAFYQFGNPTCRIYNGVVLNESKLEGMNVLFNDTQILLSTLGRHTYVQKRTTIVNAEIGKFCSIASYVSIGPGIHRIDGVSTHPSFFLKNTPLLKSFVNIDSFESSKKSIIGHDVWIGENVIVLDGVKIGNGAIIAAGAVVTKDVEPYAVVGGVPAKHIKYRFDLNTIDLLQKCEWWNYPEEWFKKNSELMLNITSFIKYLRNDKQSI